LLHAVIKLLIGIRCQNPFDSGFWTAALSHRGGMCSNCSFIPANLEKQSNILDHSAPFLISLRFISTLWDGWPGAAWKKLVAAASTIWGSQQEFLDTVQLQCLLTTW
jgi:hypothetical protein